MSHVQRTAIIQVLDFLECKLRQNNVQYLHPNMAQPQHTYVQYFIPYDGDTEEHPNVYLVKKAPKSLTLADVQQVCKRGRTM